MNHLLACSLTGVKCGATSVAKKGNQIMKTLMALTRLENIGLGTLKTLENPSKLQEIIFHGGKGRYEHKIVMRNVRRGCLLIALPGPGKC